jgi:hypothetical protein
MSVFTLFHVLLSLVGIGSGLVVVYEMLASRQSNRWTNIFLTTTAATSVTGFLFPFHGFTPAIGLGILSLIVLGIAFLALRGFRTGRNARRTYVISSVAALYFNVFVLIVQLFRRVPALQELAPTQSEPPFQITQLAVLLLFIAIAVRASMKFRAEPLHVVKVSSASA